MKVLHRVMIMAAGTGGHVFPGLALAAAWQAKGVEVVWLGTPDGMEKQWVEAANIPFYAIRVQGLRSKRWRGWITAPWRLTQAWWQAHRLIKHLAPDCVLGMGGFICGPGGLAAKSAGLPLYLHEQNAIAGLTNRLLAPLAKRVFCGFPVKNWQLKHQQLVGNPVRQAIRNVPVIGFERAEVYPKQLLVVGGSRGARALNEILPKALAKIPTELQPAVMHQTGQAEVQTTQARYDSMGLAQVKVVAFIEDMASAYRESDLVIARAGALTVSELQAAKRPAIFIPFPYAVDDHQSANADVLVNQGLSSKVIQSELSPEGLAQLIQVWLANEQWIKASQQLDQQINMGAESATQAVLASIASDVSG